MNQCIPRADFNANKAVQQMIRMLMDISCQLKATGSNPVASKQFQMQTQKLQTKKNRINKRKDSGKVAPRRRNRKALRNTTRTHSMITRSMTLKPRLLRMFREGPILPDFSSSPITSSTIHEINNEIAPTLMTVTVKKPRAMRKSRGTKKTKTAMSKRPIECPVC